MYSSLKTLKENNWLIIALDEKATMKIEEVKKICFSLRKF